jgi:TonB family protein
MRPEGLSIRESRKCRPPWRVTAGVVLVALVAGGCASGPPQREIESMMDCRRLVAGPAASLPPSAVTKPGDSKPTGHRLLTATLDRSQLPPEPEGREHPLDPPLDPNDPRMQGYFQTVKQKIEAYWVYPREARRQSQAGSGTAVLTLTQDGRLRDVSVVRSSGSDVLDRYFVDAIRLAAPFSRLPCRISEGAVPITINFAYRLSGP